MDVNNSRPMDTDEEPPVMDTVDWRTNLQPDDFRNQIVNNMLGSLKKYLSYREVLLTLEQYVEEFEEEAYNEARSEWSYLLKISHTMVLAASKFQNTLSNHRPPEQGSVGIQNSILSLVSPSNLSPGMPPLSKVARCFMPALSIQNSVHWRWQLEPYIRDTIFTKMLETCGKYLQPLSRKLEDIFWEFEESLYSEATSQWDYMWQLSQMMSNVETKFQNTTPNHAAIVIDCRIKAQVYNQSQSLGMPWPPNQSPVGVQSSSKVTQSFMPFEIHLSSGKKDVAASLQYYWWTHVRPSYRQKIFNMMMDTCKKHISFSGPEGLDQLEDAVSRFEESVFRQTISLWHYHCSVSQTMRKIETNCPNTIQYLMLKKIGQNPSVPASSENVDVDKPSNVYANSLRQMAERLQVKSQQQSHGSTSLDSTAQTGISEDQNLEDEELTEMDQEVVTELQHAFDGLSYH